MVSLRSDRHIFPNVSTDWLLMNCYLIAIHLLLYCYLTLLSQKAGLNRRFYFPVTQLKDATWQNEPNSVVLMRMPG
jgi:hypothetical protein